MSTVIKGFLKPRKAKEEKVAPKTKELIFESENQAILSCDQLRTLYKWWDSLSPDLKEKIENREVQIKVIGYTSDTGKDRYNHKLGGERAQDVAKMIEGLVATDSDGKGLIDIKCSSRGEWTEDDRRYVKIIVKQK